MSELLNEPSSQPSDFSEVLIHDIPLGQSSLADNIFRREQAAITLAGHLYITADHVFIYEVMALTCGIQAFTDNNKEVWFTSGLCCAEQQS